MRILRILVHTGPPSWVKDTLDKSAVDEENPIRVPNGTVREIGRISIDERTNILDTVMSVAKKVLVEEEGYRDYSMEEDDGYPD